MSFNIFLFLKFNRKVYNRISFFFKISSFFPHIQCFISNTDTYSQRDFSLCFMNVSKNICLFRMPFSLHSVSDCALRVSAESEQPRWGDSNALPERQVYQWLPEQLTELSKLLWIHCGFARTRERWLLCGNVYVLYFSLTTFLVIKKRILKINIKIKLND